LDLSRCKRLHDLIHAEDILVLPGVFDGPSARLVETAGFKAGFISGAGISEFALGWADMGIMGYAENVQACERMAACCGLPLLGDADTGYGNAVNVHFATKGFERAGLAGILIEDQVWPKRCGHMRGKEVIPAEEAAEKIRAAAEARADPHFVIMARTDSLATHGIKEVVHRLNRYAEAGASLLFADALLSISDIETVVSEVDLPLCVNMGFGIRQRSTTPLLSAKQLQDLGVAAVIFPRLLTAAAIKGMQNALDALGLSLSTGEVVDRPDLLLSFEELNSLLGLEHLLSLEKRYLTSEQKTSKYQSPAT
jgi:2-methylisocitrate lyase-like PEP mutase family enzyme